MHPFVKNIAPAAHSRFPLRVAIGMKWLCLLVLLSLTASASAATNAVAKLDNTDCLNCHTDPSNTHEVNGQKVPLAVFPTNSFARSVHSMFDCTDCHSGVKELVHDAK